MRQDFNQLTITSLQVREDPGSSILLGLERDNQKLISGFWNPSDAHAHAADNSNTQMVIDHPPAGPRQDQPPTLCNQLWSNKPSPALQLHQSLIPIIRVDDSQVLYETAQAHTKTDMHEGSSWNKGTLNTTQSGNTSMESNWSSNSARAKGITYPTHCDDVMAGLSYCLASST